MSNSAMLIYVKGGDLLCSLSSENDAFASHFQNEQLLAVGIQVDVLSIGDDTFQHSSAGVVKADDCSFGDAWKENAFARTLPSPWVLLCVVDGRIIVHDGVDV